MRTFRKMPVSDALFQLHRYEPYLVGVKTGVGTWEFFSCPLCVDMEKSSLSWLRRSCRHVATQNRLAFYVRDFKGEEWFKVPGTQHLRKLLDGCKRKPEVDHAT